MPTDVVPDPHWAASDLLEHARRVAALATAPDPGPALRDGVDGLQVRCARLDADPVLAAVPARRRPRVADALDRLACASDDLAAVVERRCCGAGATAPCGPAEPPDVVALLARVTARHDHVVAVLGGAGVRRSVPSA
jgi:hypothetical protein